MSGRSESSKIPRTGSTPESVDARVWLRIQGQRQHVRQSPSLSFCSWGWVEVPQQRLLALKDH